MDSCGCIYVEADEPMRMLCKRESVARKQHKCTECNQTIEPGEKYEYHRGVMHDEVPQVYKTCVDCVSIRNEFFCGSWCYEMILEDLRTHIDEIDGQISSDCLLRLTPGARDMVIDMVDDYFDLMDEKANRSDSFKKRNSKW